jgi:1-acyl-sn-glycerol-3-phosphate acyltransferase
MASGVMQPSQLIPGAYSARFVQFFTWYTKRLFRKKFFAVRLARGSAEVLLALQQHRGPAMIAMTHSSWWDPLVALLLGTLCSARQACAPMDEAMLRKFGFFRRLGIFGIRPEDPRGLPAMVAYVLERFAQESQATLWITPQGRFCDVREPIELRPGAAAVAARAQRQGMKLEVVVVAVEYGFWVDQKPEVFVRAARVEAEESAADASGTLSTAAWQRKLQEAMQRCADELATLVRARDASAFESLITAGGGINPAMDAWQRLRGTDARVVDRTKAGG